MSEKDYLKAKLRSKQESERGIYNALNPTFKKLTRFFSGPITKYKVPTVSNPQHRIMDDGGREIDIPLKRDKEYFDFNQQTSEKAVQVLRAEKYLDFESMDQYPEINTALDIYASDITSYTEFAEILQIITPNDEIKEVLKILFYDTLNVEMNLFSWVRSCCKYGDFFMWLDLDPKIGITRSVALPTLEVERLENEDPTNPNYVKFQWNKTGTTFQNFEIAHFRILGDDKMYPYGVSVLEGARRIFRQLCLRGSTNIWTPTGYEQIKNIKVGDSIFSFDFKTKKIIETKVKNAICTGVKEVFEIKTANKKLYLTEDHPVMMPDGTFKNVKDLTTNDYLVLPTLNIKERFIPEFVKPIFKIKLSKEGIEFASKIKNRKKQISHLIPSNISLQEYGNKFNSFFDKRNLGLEYNLALKICETLNIDKKYLIEFSSYKTIDFDLLKNNFSKFMRFLGFYIGDGWIDSNSVCFSMGSNSEKMDKYLSFLKELNLNIGFNNSKKKSTTSACRINSTHFKLILENLGFTTGSHKKRIPEWIYRCSNEDKKEFLLGFFDADGSMKNDHSWNVALCNKNLLQDLKILADQIGFLTTQIYSYKLKDAIIADNKKITKNSVAHACAFSSFSQYLKTINDVSCQKIWNIEKQIEKEEVYDIEVDDINHNFLAEGVVVSNCLIEEFMLAYRMTRSPERLVFYLDTKGIEPDKREAAVEKAISNLKRQSVIDSTTGRINMKYNAASVEENIFIPLTQGSETRVESLPGGQFTGAIDDVKYLRDKLFSALKIPASYLSSEGSAEDRTALAQKDIVFARTVLRIQNSIIAELTKIAMVHLLTLGYTGKDLLNFKLRLNNPSRIAEMQELEQLKSRTAVASSLSETYFSKQYIYKNVYSLNDEQIARLRMEIMGDSKFNAYLSSMEASVGGGGDAGGGGYGTLGDLGLQDLEGSTMEGGPPGDMGGAPDSNLLVTPESEGLEQGRRFDDAYLTPGAKGKSYNAVRPEMDKRLSSGRSKQMKSNVARTTLNNLFPGYKSLDSLSRGITTDSIDRDQEVIKNTEMQIAKTKQLLDEKKELINNKFAEYLKTKRKGS